MTQILLVDDHPIIRVGYRSLLESEEDLEICAEAGNCAEAIAAVEAQKPDVIVLDLILRNEDGLTLLKDLLARFPDLQVLIVSMQKEEVYAERALRAGAGGYLMKEEAPELLIQAVRTIIEGNIFLTPKMSILILDRVLRNKKGDTSPVASLSDRELHVYHLVGAALGTREIAEQLKLSPKTIESYQANIKTKLGLPDAVALRESARRWVENLDPLDFNN